VLHLPAARGRLRARLFAAGVVSGERHDETGWQLDIDAPMARLEPLFGLPDGDGAWLKRSLKLGATRSI
jgi:GTP-binding protein HflX